MKAIVFRGIGDIRLEEGTILGHEGVTTRSAIMRIRVAPARAPCFMAVQKPRDVPMVVELVRSGQVDTTKILTQSETMANAIDAFKAFDEPRPGWIKV